jgi:hypothetical protein
MYFDTSLKRLGETSPKYRDPGSCHATRILWKRFFFGVEERRKGTIEKGTEDTSKLVQIEEVKCAIEKLPFLTVLSPVRGSRGRGEGMGLP